jgi:hypothetical protein
VIDSPHGANGTHGGSVAAPIWQRIAEPALQYLGVGPDIDPAPQVLVARHDDSDGESTPKPTVSLVADGEPGTVPDLRGMSAREAVRKLVMLGMHARASGDGVVISQDPPPGTPLDPGAVCRLVLDRKSQP